MQARTYLIRGRVQGVGFRFFAADAARQLGLKGYVRNLYDGRVEVYAIGSVDVLEQFKTWLAAGPTGGRVEAMEERTAPLLDHPDFSIAPSA